MKFGLLIFFFLFLFSCKQNNVFNGIEPNTSRVLAEFTDARTGTYVTKEFDPNVIVSDLTEIRLDPRSVIDDEARVKVIVNPVVVTEYNTANGTSFKPVPAGEFSLVTNEFTFNAETRKAIVRAHLRPSALLDDSYAIGLSIAEVRKGEISNIGKDVIVFISIKNDYDGIYSIKGYSDIPGSAFTGLFTVPCSEELEVVTSSASSVFISPTQPVASGSSFAYISNLLPDIQFDLTSNKVTAVTPRAGGIGLIFPFDAGYNSRYDPATKTIYVKYGVEPVGSGRFIIDTLTFCRPR